MRARSSKKSFRRELLSQKLQIKRRKLKSRSPFQSRPCVPSLPDCERKRDLWQHTGQPIVLYTAIQSRETVPDKVCPESSCKVIVLQASRQFQQVFCFKNRKRPGLNCLRTPKCTSKNSAAVCRILNCCWQRCPLMQACAVSVSMQACAASVRRALGCTSSL